MSVDTNVARRRDTSNYRVVFQGGVELLVSPVVRDQFRHLSIDLKRFLVFRNLKAVAELASGQELGRRTG